MKDEKEKEGKVADYSVLSEVQQKIFDKVKAEWVKRAGGARALLAEADLKRLIIMADTQFDGKKRVTVEGTTYLVPIEDIILYGLKGSEINKYPKEGEKKPEIPEGGEPADIQRIIKEAKDQETKKITQDIMPKLKEYLPEILAPIINDIIKHFDTVEIEGSRIRIKFK